MTMTLITIGDLTSIRSALAHPAVATLFAFGGILLGAVIRKVVRFHVSLLVAAAIGTLLAVTLYDVLPDAKQFITWPALLIGCASGYLLLWVIGRYVYHVCPACAINELCENPVHQFSSTAVMLMITFGFHTAMDGVSIVFGDDLLGRPDVGLLFGISIHKIPEGLALVLLLLGAGYGRKKAILWAAGMEAMTLAGGALGYCFVGSISTLWLGILFAHIAGGFLYMVVNTFKGMLTQHNAAPRYALHVLVSSLSFISSSLVLVLARS
ncbi:MAG TPA: ZIP family metal transporter [Terriglobales bacterium]|jgi:zinc transporter ZupT|nr:ZIP family metal transporter [Terriglobales bacterium]